jgi:hypothetical protein
VAQAVRRKARAFAAAVEHDPEAVVETLTGPGGVQAPGSAEQQAGCSALGAALEVAPDALRRPLVAALAAMLDMTEHNALSPADIKIYRTPEGAAGGFARMGPRARWGHLASGVKLCDVL